MQRFIMGLFLLIGMTIAAANEPAADVREDAISKAMESFTGTWRIASVQPEGATRDASRLVFKRDGSYAALDNKGKELWAGTFEIDPTTAPKRWDHRSHEAKKDGKDVLGIYELEGGKMKVACVVGQWNGKQWAGKPRPTVFDPKQVDVTIELERMKSGK